MERIRIFGVPFPKPTLGLMLGLLACSILAGLIFPFAIAAQSHHHSPRYKLISNAAGVLIALLWIKLVSKTWK